MNSLSQPYVQIIGFITKINFRKYPKWINENLEYKEYVVLNGNTSEKEVDLFLIEIFRYNKIYINREPENLLNSLLYLKQAIIGGGILFAGDGNWIFPGCCCGLEQ